MISRPGKGSALLSSVVAVLLVSGCRNHMPHSFTWPAGGDIQYTHAKPPEGGYHSNWDPYAVSLEVTPIEDVNPVRTQHVLVATVRDAEGKPLPNRRVEWIISEGSVGDIIEVDESGWRASRGYKVTNKYAVSHTNNFEHVLDMGNDDPSDDIALEVGQTWCVITSPIEGTTHVTAYAPGIYDWSKHKVFVVKHWYDVRWEFPPPATNPTGTPHPMTTYVMKHSDGTPLPGHVVTYTVVDGPSAIFQETGGTTATVNTDDGGAANVTLVQTSPAEGTNTIEIDIVRPADEVCCKPGAHIATGRTTKTWIGPKIAIAKSAPAERMANEQFEYAIEVSNPSQVAATNVQVTDTLPDGIVYHSSSPSASVSGQNLSWSLGTLGGGERQSLSVTVSASRTGTFTNCANVTADQGLSDRACADTRVTSAQLVLEKQCPSEVLLCEPIPYTIVVRNTGDGPATNVQVTDDLPEGLVTDSGRRQVVFNVGTLQGGEARKGEFVAKAERTGTFTNRASATGDGGLSASADCTTTVRQPVLEVTKSGPEMRFVGRPAEFNITVTNTGDAPARDTILTDTIPAGAQFVEASNGGNASGGNVTWNLGTLAPGETSRVTVTISSRQTGVLQNTASARAFCAEDAASAQVEIRGIPAILLEVVDIEDPIEVGSNVTYVIEVTNQGTAVGTNIVIRATVPGEQEFVSLEGPTQGSVDGAAIMFEALPRLEPGARAVYKVINKGVQVGDSRFAVTMTSDQLTSPVQETEATNVY